jgi:membrane dipeptidase
MKKIDLHNDLLHYVSYRPNRTAYDPWLECSIPYMLQGGIAIQVLAMFAGPDERPGQLYKQYKIFKDLKETEEAQSGRIDFQLAIEGAEQLLSESPLGATPDQTLRQLIQFGVKPIYVSLTWLHENSFGGGDRSKIGLKMKGRELLRVLNQYDVSIDLSHASDELAHDIIEFREANHLTNGILVSHTTFRGLNPIIRNVSDDVARYVASVGGVIGLSLSRSQIGINNSVDISKQIQYAGLLSNEVSRSLCLGGDLFHQEDVPEKYRIKGGSFAPELCTAGQYTNLENLGKDFVYENAARFLRRYGVQA